MVIIGEQPAVEMYDPLADFASTEYGQRLRENIRYARYRPDDISNEEWVGLLGADVNNLSHMPLSRNIARVFIRELRQTNPDYHTVEEESDIILGLGIHDEAEAITGDITYDDKTDDDETFEEDQFVRHLPNFHPNAPQDVLDHLGSIVRNVLFNTTSRPGQTRATIEGVGYMRTALRASRSVLSERALESGAELDENLRWLVADVLSNMTSKLTTSALEYGPVWNYFLHPQIQREISEAFVVARSADFAKYEAKQAIMEAKFAEARPVWEAWLRSHGQAAVQASSQVA